MHECSHSSRVIAQVHVPRRLYVCVCVEVYMLVFILVCVLLCVCDQLSALPAKVAKIQ